LTEFEDNHWEEDTVKNPLDKHHSDIWSDLQGTQRVMARQGKGWQKQRTDPMSILSESKDIQKLDQRYRDLDQSRTNHFQDRFDYIE